jgi:phage tail-like protein
MAEYPLPAFSFQVDWGGSKGTAVGFAEVSGLTIENQAIEYRDGASKDYAPMKMPGMPKYSNVTLKRGIVPKDNEFFSWLNKIKLNKLDQDDRRNLTISLLNENHEPVMTWKARNAFPVKIEGPSLKSTGNEVALESIEIAHEGLTIENE